MSEKNYPYKSKVVLTEKQASKEPVGSYYHPTEKTFRSGACPVGMTLKKGYHRKGYMKMNGTVINNTNVDPVCVKNKGLPGKLLKKDKEDFKEFGYLTTDNNNTRFKSLLEACKVLSYGNVIRKLNSLKKRSSKKDDNKSIKLYNIYSSDILILQKWRLKNPDLYKVKSELLLVGGQIFGKKKVDNNKLKEIIEDLKKYVSGEKKIGFAPKLSKLNVSEITDTSGLFENFDFKKATELGYDVNITGWKLERVENMSEMFYNCTNFNQDLSSWGQYLGNVKNMSGMFYNCANFEGKSLEGNGLGEWGPYLGNVKNMSKMFYNCAKFNQDLSSWGPYLDNVRNMSGMFYNCIKFNQDLIWGLHLGNVENMSKMFNGCTNFNQNLSTWGPYLGKVKNMSYMFYNCTNFEGNGLGEWGQYLSNVTDMSAMFAGCTNFDQDLSSWGPYLHKVKDMSGMFSGCTKFKGKGLGKWGPYLNLLVDLDNMLSHCISFNFSETNKWRKIADLREKISS